MTVVLLRMESTSNLLLPEIRGIFAERERLGPQKLAERAVSIAVRVPVDKLAVGRHERLLLQTSHTFELVHLLTAAGVNDCRRQKNRRSIGIGRKQDSAAFTGMRIALLSALYIDGVSPVPLYGGEEGKHPARNLGHEITSYFHYAQFFGKTGPKFFELFVNNKENSVLLNGNRQNRIDIVYIAVYTMSGEVTAMETAKVFENGRSQAVRLPKKFRFNEDEVVVQQLGDAVLLVPKGSLWKIFTDGLNGFTDDIFQDGRNQGIQEKRENL